MKPPSTRLQLHPPQDRTASRDIEGRTAREIIAGAKETVRPWIENDIEILTEILGELRKERDCLEERHHRFLTEEREQLETFRAEYEYTRDQLADASKRLDESRRELNETREQLQQDVVRWRTEPKHFSDIPEKKKESERDTSDSNLASNATSGGVHLDTAALLDELGTNLAELESPKTAEDNDADAILRHYEEETPGVFSATGEDEVDETPTATATPAETHPTEEITPDKEGHPFSTSPTAEPDLIESPVLPTPPSVSTETSSIGETAPEFAPETGVTESGPASEPSETTPQTPPMDHTEAPVEVETKEEFHEMPSSHAAETSVDEFTEDRESRIDTPPAGPTEVDDDSSLEEYLTQFTKRFGISDWGSSQTPWETKAQAAPGAESKRDPTEEAYKPEEERHTGSMRAVSDEEETPRVPPKTARVPRGIGEESSVAQAPADIDRMRNLANLSSERVLMIHELRRLKNQAKSQLGLAAAAFIIGVTLMATRWLFHVTDLVVWFASGFFVGASLFLLGHLWSTRSAAERRKELNMLTDDEVDSLAEQV